MISTHPLHLLHLLSAPLLLLLLLTFLPPPLLSFPTTPIASNTTTTLPLLPLTAGRDLECFNLTTPKAHPVDLADCPQTIDLLYHDPTGVMSLQQFSHDPALPSTFRVPFAWQFGNCQILLTSGGVLAVDTFRLADVIFKAERIMQECPPKSKKSLGGLALVGHGETFFVAVNGPDLAPDGIGEGGRGNGTGLVRGVGDVASGVAGGDLDLMSEGVMDS